MFGALWVKLLLSLVFVLSVATDLQASTYSVLEKVKEAKNVLAPYQPRFKLLYTNAPKTKKKRTQKKIPYALEREVALIGLNMKDGTLRRFDFSETVTLDPKKRPKVTPPQVIASNDECAVIWRGGSRWGYKRNLLLDCQGQYFVVLRIMMPSYRSEPTIITGQKSGKRKCVSGPKQIITGAYSPYAPELYQKDLVREGRLYLESVILKALQQLSAAYVRSKTPQEEYLSETASLELLQALLINEHMDSEEFLAALSVKPLVESYWVEIALNKEGTHGLSVSPADAVGIAQFICPSYAEDLTAFPEAKLDAAFLRGMRDHVNAIKAMVVHMDLDAALRWSLKTRSFCGMLAERMEECKAVSYFAGPKKLHAVVDARSQLWDTRGVITKGKRKFFPPQLGEQALIYLQKFRKIREYLLET
ncbi:MAG: hypothetical protein HYW89_01150 [Candidatus Sungiibacteriota bacterium]|uniref:Transglycosylase SLT domain-containing protein n=1 Tax=Candidatus Sungiibacteriota bacterium TaxID=2750080 RepID=A0A7T5USC1_9BACT|nr:MAG: hypothetical protein HYW89_01150 [Candidatus Sungbacteria bacterium]